MIPLSLFSVVVPFGEVSIFLKEIFGCEPGQGNTSPVISLHYLVIELLVKKVIGRILIGIFFFLPLLKS